MLRKFTFTTVSFPRKRESVLFFIMIFLCSIPLSAFAANFPDVPSSHKYSYAIQTLKDAGIISGYGDDTFEPDKTVSRAEATAIILKAAGITTAKTSAVMPFTDVPENSWFFPMIQKGLAMGKLKGYEDKTFRPANPVTLPEALALLLNFNNINTKNIEIETVIYDGLFTKNWYAPYAQYAKNNNLIEPDKDGHVSASDFLKRGELAELIYRFRISRTNSKPYDITSGWTTTEHADNYWQLRHPADWVIFKGVLNSVIWKKTSKNTFLSRVWPSGASLSISLIENPENLSAAQYFAKLKEDYKKEFPQYEPVYSSLIAGGRPALKIDFPQKNIIDLALQLPNQKFLYMYGQYGSAPIGEYLKKQLELILASYQFIEKPPIPPEPVIPLENRMETLRENILVQGGWDATVNLFKDKRLINTDAIGIGTGPVDYYYSAEANTTIKLERNSKTILNIREGQSSSF